MTIKEYREITAPGYSILSKLAFHPKAAKASMDREQKKTKSLDFGSLVDTLLTRPEDFESEYHIINAKVPSEGYMKLLTEYIRLRELYEEEAGSLDLFDKDTTILTARSNVAFQSNWKDATIIEKFKEECKSYLDEYEAAEGKIIMSSFDNERANVLSYNAKTNAFTAKYFTPAEGIEIHYQVPIIFKTPKGELIKSLLDILYIDHNNKTIQPSDIKTFSDNFLKNYYSYRYYYQGGIYTFAAQAYAIEHGLEDYTILPFEFLTLDTSGFENPTIYRMSIADLESATFGGMVNNRDVVGWTILVSDFYWHWRMISGIIQEKFMKKDLN